MSCGTNLVNLRGYNLDQWRADPNNVYIGRAHGTTFMEDSVWANKWRITDTCTREEAIRNYESHINSDPVLCSQVGELWGKTLGCWCVPQSCHGEVLLKMISNKFNDDNVDHSVTVNETDDAMENKITGFEGYVMDMYSQVVLEDVSTTDISHKSTCSSSSNNVSVPDNSFTIDSDSKLVSGDNRTLTCSAVGDYSKPDCMESTASEDFQDLLKTYWSIHNDNREIRKQLEDVLEVVKGKDRRLSVLLEDNEFLRTENTKLKNELKLQKQISYCDLTGDVVVDHSTPNNTDVFDTDTSVALFSEGTDNDNIVEEVEVEDEFHKKTHRELQQLQEELHEFRKYVYSELTSIKEINENKSYAGPTLNSNFTVNSNFNSNVQNLNVLYETEDGEISNHMDIPTTLPPPHMPGNSSYAEMTKNGKKVVILSDSMSKNINMASLNRGLKKKTAYWKYFPGASPEDIQHYCTRTLEKDQPDVAIIHVGTNRLEYDDPFVIAGEIVKIVNLCHERGCNEVYVSEIVDRPDLHDQVKQLNNVLNQWQLVRNFTIIYNGNIKKEFCLSRDRLHLNYRGSNRLCSNFRRALNRGVL